VSADDEDIDEALRCFGLQRDDDVATSQAPEVCDVWPEHMQALELFLSCIGQFGISLGGMGGAHWSALQATTLAQEARWQGLQGRQQASVVRQYRTIEKEALRILNDREAQAARKSN
jgi:hypothetical protein